MSTPAPTPAPQGRTALQKAKRPFVIWLTLAIITLVLYPIVWIFIGVASGTTKDVGQGFYIVFIWMGLFPFLLVFGIMALITGIKYFNFRKAVRAYEATGNVYPY